ncbi:hypothetical protein HELRODRAFT_189732 [Helobdella robusta]|uniref:RRM domain-containing protein n=1 Tax=Helobdella robusta TaxID=6412 RepID=T1FRB2_HELRO|nr:hypothetical protein HELRODRAFT_189732 [Helobdella robusta]ESN91574.1 hypothetical protein HELRODRAFT_189732 [Helobdella robusta]
MSRMAKRSRSRSPASVRTRSQSPKKWRKPDRRGMADRGDKKEERVRVYVSNLPYDVKWQALKDIFKDKVGNDVTYAQLYEDLDGKPVGAGVVEVRNRETAMKAIEELDRFEIRGRKIIVREEREKDRQRHNRDLGLHRNEGGMPISGGSGNFMGGPNMMSGGGAPQGFTADWLNQLGIDVTQITNQVFVANLDYKVTKSKLEEVFRMAGNVIEAELKLDKDGKSRGLGIVRYEHPIEAVQAISLFTNQFMYDRQMHVRLDRWVEPMLQDIPSRLPTGLKSIGIGMGAQGQPLLNIGEIANTLTLSILLGQTNNQHPPPAINMNNNNIPMNHPIQNNANLATNLLGNLSNNNLGNLGNLTNLINPGANLGGLGSGAGALGGQLIPQQANAGNMVTQTAQAILNTLGLNALTGLGGLDLAANLGGVGGMAAGVGGSNALGIGVQNSADIGHSLINQNMSFSAMQNVGYDNRDGRGSNFDRNSGGDITAVFIKNLPFNFSANNLYEKFRVYGDIKYADIKTDSAGRSRGSAVVQYFNADSARRAICLAHGSMVDDRQIEVKLDRLA